MFIEFLRLWWKGPKGVDALREVGVSRMGNEGFRRDVLSVYAIDSFFGFELRNWYLLNWYMSNAFTFAEYCAEHVLFDRLVIDFDSHSNPQEAVDCATSFAKSVESIFGATPIVVCTGFKGAHVHIFFSNFVDWVNYQCIYNALLAFVDCKKFVDLNMLQWNRLSRVPLTYNVKEGKRLRTRIVYPFEVSDFGEFSWRFVKLLDVSRIPIVKVVFPKPLDAIVIGSKPRSWKWVEKVAEIGLPDGRKRFILYVLSPYLVNVAKMSFEDSFKVIKRFVDSSCINFGNCSKIYDSWILGDLKRVREKHVMPKSLKSIEEEDRELYNIIKQVLEKAKN